MRGAPRPWSNDRLQEQRVSDDYHGIIIQNGQKRIQ